jgi:hypothetical protein
MPDNHVQFWVGAVCLGLTALAIAAGQQWTLTPVSAVLFLGAVIAVLWGFLGRRRSKRKAFVLTNDVPPHLGFNFVNRQLRLATSDDGDIDGVQVWLTKLQPSVDRLRLPLLLLPKDGPPGSNDYKFTLRHGLPREIGVFGTITGKPDIFQLFTMTDGIRHIKSLPSDKRYHAEITATGDEANPLRTAVQFGVNEKREPIITISTLERNRV